ncbi:hypothetical protein U1Q18_047174, partial [Sarracenia purpurea var. burkii]
VFELWCNEMVSEEGPERKCGACGEEKEMMMGEVFTRRRGILRENFEKALFVEIVSATDNDLKLVLI